MTLTATLERKRAILEQKKQKRNKAAADLAILEKNEVEAREKHYKSVTNKVVWFALSQPVKLITRENGQIKVTIDHAATRRLRNRVIDIADMIDEPRHPADILDALIEFLVAEKARLSCRDGRYGRPRDEGEGR